MFGLIALTVVLALVFMRKGKIKGMKWLQRLIVVSPVFPLIAIQCGWFTAELGRQPWVVYPSATGPEGVSLLTTEGVSQSVSNVELLITMTLFLLVYLFLIVAWARVMGRFIKEGPVEKPVLATAGASGAASGGAESGEAWAPEGDRDAAPAALASDDVAKEGE